MHVTNFVGRGRLPGPERLVKVLAVGAEITITRGPCVDVLTGYQPRCGTIESVKLLDLDFTPARCSPDRTPTCRSGLSFARGKAICPGGESPARLGRGFLRVGSAIIYPTNIVDGCLQNENRLTFEAAIPVSEMLLAALYVGGAVQRGEYGQC
jgi:hypothetical protein